jgi:hypothetical protein
MYSDYSHNTLLPLARLRITAVIVLLLCNWYSSYSYRLLLRLVLLLTILVQIRALITSLIVLGLIIQCQIWRQPVS